MVPNKYAPISATDRNDRFQLNLEGTKIEFKIENYRPSTKDEYYEEWCLITVKVKGNGIDYSTHSECMMCCEIEWLNSELENMINGVFSEDRQITFLEPDFEFLLFPSKESNYYMDWKFRLWYKGALTCNYFVLSFVYDDIQKLKKYLEKVIENGKQ